MPTHTSTSLDECKIKKLDDGGWEINVKKYRERGREGGREGGRENLNA